MKQSPGREAEPAPPVERLPDSGGDDDEAEDEATAGPDEA